MSVPELPPNIWANVSASPSTAARNLGWDEDGFNNLLLRVADFFLHRGFHLLWGHDWREDGVMRAVADQVEKRMPVTADSRSDTMPKMLNICPQPLGEIHPSGTKAVEDSGGVLQVFSIASRSAIRLQSGTTGWEKRLAAGPLRLASDAMLSDPVGRNWLLRKMMTRFLGRGVRLCIGGRLQGFSGIYPGVAEEAVLTLLADQPLYVLGGRGIASAAVAKYLTDTPDAIYLESVAEAELEANLPAQGLSAEHVRLAKKMRLPLDGLGDLIASRRQVFQPENQPFGRNGLSENDNKRLFITTDIEEALHLVDRGIRQLLVSGQM